MRRSKNPYYWKKVYVAVFHTGEVKVGVTGCQKSRRLSLSRMRGKCPTMFYVSSRHPSAYRIEARAHRILGRWRTSGEFFDVTPRLATTAVKRAMQDVDAGWTVPKSELFGGGTATLLRLINERPELIEVLKGWKC